MKRTLALLLAGILASIMVGCGGGDEASQGGGDPKKQIDSNAKPTLPRPGMSVGGGASAEGAGAAKVEPQ